MKLTNVRNTFIYLLSALFPEKRLLGPIPLSSFADIPPAKPFSAQVIVQYPQLKKCTALLMYKHQHVRMLIWRIKYKKDMDSIHTAATTVNKYLYAHLHENVVLIPIPSSRRRKNERGYNQCELIVKEIQALSPTIIINDTILGKAFRTSQTTKTKLERMRNTTDTFYIRRQAHKIPDDTRIIVFDDVITTGSTISEAIKVLENAGYTDVYGLALAH